jgi:sporulation protein YlmC with PRC-barrel domain
MATVSLSELLGSTVYDASGAASGRVREVALTPQEDRSRVSLLIVKTSTGNRVLPLTAVSAINGGIKASTAAADWTSADGSEGLLLLSRDLLDQQVIDVHGRIAPSCESEAWTSAPGAQFAASSKAWFQRSPFGRCS